MARASLSVIICNYNHGHYLGDALRAILAQTRSPDEVIVIDDGSFDTSREVIQSVSSRYSIVKPVFYDRNLGVVARANEGITLASGDYLFLAAADDRVLPGFFERSMELAEQHPEVGLVCSDMVTFQDGLDEMHTTRLPLGSMARRLTPKEIFDAERKRPFLIPGHTCLLRRAAVHESGRLLADLRWHCDWFMNLVIAFRHGVAYLPGGFSAIRSRPDSYSSAGKRVWNEQKEVLKALIRHLDSAPYHDVRQAFIESSVLSQFGEEWLRLVLTEPAAIRLLTPAVLRHAIYAAIRGPLKKFLPDYVIRAGHSLRKNLAARGDR